MADEKNTLLVRMVDEKTALLVHLSKASVYLDADINKSESAQLEIDAAIEILTAGKAPRKRRTSTTS